MTISVIIPVYKVEAYIRRCIESVIEQEFDAYRIECILIDDCTPDKSMEVAEKIIKEYSGSNIKFLILHHAENKGVSAARNTGISAARGDFIYFLDSDDEIAENAFKYLFSYIVDNPSLDVVMGNMMWMELQSLTNTPVTINKNIPYLLDNRDTIWRLVLRRKVDRHVVNKLIRRSIINDNELYFDENVTIYEDVIWTYKLFSIISSMLIVPAFTYKYEINENSLTHTTAQRAKSMVESLSLVSEFILCHPPMIDGKEVHYAAHRLFASRWIMMAIDVNDKHHLGLGPVTKLNSIRSAIFWDSVKHCRPFLALFLLILFPPIKFLIRYRWFRSNLFRLDTIVYLLS